MENKKRGGKHLNRTKREAESDRTELCWARKDTVISSSSGIQEDGTVHSSRVPSIWVHPELSTSSGDSWQHTAASSPDTEESLTSEKGLWPFSYLTPVNPRLETGGKSRHWSSTLFCNCHSCLIIFYLCSPSLIWRASAITIMMTNSKSLSTLWALPATQQRAMQPLRRCSAHLDGGPASGKGNSFMWAIISSWALSVW